MNHIAYYRVSTQRQGQSGLGLDAQRSIVASYEPIAEYTEIETGTSKKSRPVLAAALAHCKAAKATLVIAKVDRLSRNVHFISGLLESGVEFIACDMPGATRFMFHIMAAVAEEEARMISVRTKAALCEAKKRGVKLGGLRNPNFATSLVKAREVLAKKRAMAATA